MADYTIAIECGLPHANFEKNDGRRLGRCTIVPNGFRTIESVVPDGIIPPEHDLAVSTTSSDCYGGHRVSERGRTST